MMQQRVRSIAVISLIYAVGCVRDPSGTNAESEAPVISDAVHSGGTPGFYFLPPLVPLPVTEGTNIPDLAPTVRIDRQDGSTLATYTAQNSPDRTYYHAAWPTANFNLSLDETYRINVLLGSRLLGFADVDVVASRTEFKRVDNNHFVPLLDDYTLPIKFFINACAATVCQPLDQCHVAGTCSIAAGGVCSNPPAPDGTACDDQDACTGTSSCQAGACVGANPLDCDDQNPCTADSCTAGGCAHAPIADGDYPGSQATTCGIGACAAHGRTECRGGSVADTCTPATPAPSDTTCDEIDDDCDGTADEDCSRDPVVANVDVYRAYPAAELIVSAAEGVLTNDVSPDGLPLTATLESGPAHGALTLAADGSFTYTPEAGFQDLDRFTYTVTDGRQSAIGQVAIAVRPQNIAPVAIADEYRATEDGSLTVSAAEGVLTNDFDPDGELFTAVLETAPQSGSLQLAADGSLTYTPNPGFSGTDRFTYSARDAAGSAGTAEVTITVLPGNDPPTAAPDSYSIAAGDTLIVARPEGVLANDTDPDGDSLIAALSTQPGHGDLILHGDGSLQYTPAPGFSGADTFTYRASDGSREATATVTITVIAPNRAPYFTSDAPTEAFSGEEYIYVATATDEDGDPLTFSLLVAPAGMTISPTGTVEWLPSVTDLGSTSVTIAVSDPHGGTATQTFPINTTRRPQFDPYFTTRPAACFEVTTGAPDDIYRYSAAATDPDGTSLTYSLVDGPSGMAIDPVTGVLTWPVSGPSNSGPRPVTIRVDDGHGGAGLQSFTVTGEIPYEFEITTFYQFAGCTSAGVTPTICGGPDTGYATVTNRGAAAFDGTVSIYGLAPLSFQSGFCMTTGSMYTGVLAPNASVTLAVSSDSSNCGGFNGADGATIHINGNISLGVVSQSISLSVSDKDIHSGVMRRSPCDGQDTDAFVLQGGAPTGCDSGDGYEVTLAPGHHILRGPPDLVTCYCNDGVQDRGELAVDCGPVCGCECDLCAGVTCAPTDGCHGAGTCDPGTGNCTSPVLANGTSCSDGDACNGEESCLNGTCTSGQGLDCEDLNPCTIDQCTTGGCTHTPVADGSSCEDGDACNGAETCLAGTCQSGSAPACTAPDECTVASCEAGAGCVYALRPTLNNGVRDADEAGVDCGPSCRPCTYAGTAANPGTSCRQILDSGGSIGDGIYFIQPPGEPAARQVYCDMTSDGGGWTAVFLGRNGSTNVFDRFDAGRYLGTFADPTATNYLQRAPASLANSTAEIAVQCGSAMVSFAMTRQVKDYLTTGALQSWVTLTTRVLAGTVANIPDTLFTGSTGDVGWILTRGQNSGGFVFASSYSTNGSWNFCNGASNTTSTVRILYRETAPAVVRNTPAEAGRSCRAILDGGNSTGDGIYYLAEPGGAPYRAYCDMTSDGGGWTTVFAGRNGSTNVFGYFDAPSYAEDCSDPATHCLRRAPASVGDRASDVAVTCGGAMVKFAMTNQVRDWLTTGRQSSWASLSPIVVSGTVNQVPDTLWTGNSATDRSFILTRGQNSGGFVFASSYSNNTSWDFCNGASNQANLVRVMYREAAAPIALNVPASARASCREILDADESRGSGVYYLTQPGGAPYTAYCDMTSDGGGWTAVFSGRNGSTNVFNHFDIPSYTEICTDPATHCQRRAPADTGSAATELAVSCGGAMVKFAMNNPARDWVRDGVQRGWVALSTSVISGSITNIPDTLWTGNSAGDQSWILTRGQNSGGFVFASSYSNNTSWDYCNGSFNRDAIVRVYYRESRAGRPLNRPEDALSSCKRILESGGSLGDGIYHLQEPGASPRLAYCDMNTDGGGWTAIFSGRNGSINVFDHFDSVGYAGVCTDPSNRCLQHLPAGLGGNPAELAFSCGGAMVKTSHSGDARDWLSTGTQHSWVNISPTTVIAGTVGQIPDTIWTGNSATDRGWILTRGQNSGGFVFASSYSNNTSWDYCNGGFNQASVARIFYRELTPPAPDYCETDPRPNTPPAFVTAAPLDAAVGDLYRYAARAVDPDGEALTFDLTQAPPGMIVGSTTGIVEWIPDADQVFIHTVSLRVTDTHGASAVETFLIAVAGASSNVPIPRITSQPPLSTTVGDIYEYSVVAVDPEGAALSFELQEAPAGMTINAATGLISWSPGPGDLGNHPVIIRARNASGGQALQGYSLRVRAPNSAPSFVSAPIDRAVAGAFYRYLARAVDPDGDPLSFSLITAPAGLNLNLGVLSWRPSAADLGAHPITVRVTDDRGLFAEQTYTLLVTPDSVGPTVNVLLSDYPVTVGQPVNIYVLATDDVGIADVSLRIAGVPVTLGPGQQTTYIPTAPGMIPFVGSARDTSGNEGSGTTTLRVLDPGDTTSPHIELLSPAPGSFITGVTQIVGTVTDPNLEFYTLAYARVGSENFITFAEGHSSVTADVLGTLDPTMMANDEYVLRITAQDVSGNLYYLDAPLGVAGQLKLGDFRLEFTDLQVALTGIPITIKRIYNTLDADLSGDFGYGWRMDMREGRIRESVRVNPAEPNPFAVNPFRMGARVYVNGPDGRRIGFTFDPVPSGGLLGTIWTPRFVADPGVYETLEVDYVPLAQRGDGTFGLYLFGFPWNPTVYTLTTKDGVRYVHDQFEGLLSVTDRNQNVLTYTDHGIFSSTGESVTWLRDGEGRITQITDPAGNQIQYTYNAEGELATYVDQEGNVTAHTYRSDRPHYLATAIDPYGHSLINNEYDQAGRLIATVDALGNRTTQSYDLDDNTELIGDPNGNEYRLVFDDRGNITSITNPRGATTHYEFDANDNVTSMTDARGFTSSRTFDSRGNVTSITDAVGQTWQFTFNSFNKMATSTDPLGRVVQRNYDARGNLVELINAAGDRSTIGYDAQGRMSSYVNNEGELVTFEYATLGDDRATRVINADGTIRDFEYDFYGFATKYVDEDGRETRFTYDDIGHPLAVTDGAGFTATVQYGSPRPISTTDALGRVTYFQYDEQGRIVQATDPAGGIELVTYDANNQVTSVTDPGGRVWSYTYLGDGKLASSRDPLGREIRFEYDLAGNRTAVIDAAGRRTSFEYDGLDRLVRRVDPTGGVRQWNYDAVGNLVSWIDENGRTTSQTFDVLNRLTQRTDASGGVWLFQYDEEGRLTRSVDPNGHAILMGWDDRGRMISRTDAAGGVTQFVYDGAGNLIETIDPLGQSWRNIYDGRNKVTMMIDPAGNTSLFAYDAAGNQTHITDASGRTTIYAYDELNRMVSETHPDGTEVLFGWDAVGNQVSLTNPGGETTHFAYDAAGQIVEEIDPRGHATHYTYDPAGNLIERLDRNGRARRFGYDGLDRLIQESWWDGAAQVRAISWTVDGLGNKLSVEDPDSRYAFTYDGMNRILSASNAGTPNAPSLTLTYTYDGAGNRLSAQDQHGVRVDYAYDARNWFLGSTWQGGGIAPARADYAYDARGQVRQIDRYADAAGMVRVGRSVLDYDGRRMRSSFEHRDGAGAVLAGYATQFDPAGRLGSLTKNGQVSSFSYNLDGQLIQATHTNQPNESYSYDTRGNRTGGGMVTGANNLILSDGTYSYEYDLEGNRTRKTELAGGAYSTYSYDHRNRLTAVEDHDAAGLLVREVLFTYDALDRRIAKIVDGAPQYFVYDGDHVWADHDGAGNVTARYLFGDQIDGILARHRPGEGTAWYLTDHQGTVRDLANGSGALAYSADYDSFGTVGAEVNAAFGDRYKFTGREYDEETGLYYYRWRYYDAAIGQFINEDPISFDAGDANLRRYVGNDPGSSVDPYGTMAMSGDAVLTRSGPAGALLISQRWSCFFISLFAGWATRRLINAATGDWPTAGEEIRDTAIDIIIAGISCAFFPTSAAMNLNYGAVAITLDLALARAAAVATVAGSAAVRTLILNGDRFGINIMAMARRKGGGSEHTSGARPSTEGKHQRGQARKQAQQRRSEELAEEGGNRGRHNNPNETSNTPRAQDRRTRTALEGEQRRLSNELERLERRGSNLSADEFARLEAIKQRLGEIADALR